MSALSDRAGVDLPIDTAWLSVPAGVLLAGAVLLFAPLPGDAAAMLAITAFCISLWVGTPVPPWLTGLVGIGLIGARFSTDLALYGFAMPATWLILVGILIGEATRRSGLAVLVERGVLSAMPARATDDAVAAYRYLLGAFSAIAVGFVLLVPSALVRVLILGPILVSAGGRFAERRARVGLFLGPLFVTFYGGAGVLTGSLPNIIITGITESAAGVSIGWVEWLVWMGPVMTVGRSLAVVAVAYLLYRPTDADALDADAGVPDAAADGDERRMLAFLLVGVAVWATDSVHGLHPLYGALVVAVLAFLPRVGVVELDAVGDADFSIAFFLGAIFAIAEGLGRTAFTDIAAGAALSAVPADAPLPLVLAAVAVVSVAVTFVMEGLAATSVITPVLVSFATDAGVPLLPVAMIEAVSLVAYVFPYQSAVLVAILSLDMVDPRELIRMTAACSVVTLLVLIPVQIGVFTVAF
ncbi:SLC13 family permease [Candidatus Halobonum tyrrellensis]|uniref:Sodium symporter transmembrane protein n=1 Tax=Candidatus Halobonum tyrrellensis G22 TaxID=1324957 RepID=V4HGY7_9EURY|nr:SLC13 family permease [Candidatus Halobonum tyrrellensis]ESP89980.1 sodium symporter transmembrane protein [Candidatus Halobonum tyrrellensis G22]